MKLTEAIEKGHEVYFKNGYWKGVYDDAPEDAKKYFDLIFSLYVGREDAEYMKEFKEAQKGMYEGLTDKGWDYLLENTSSNMEKSHLRKNREKYQKKEQ